MSTLVTKRLLLLIFTGILCLLGLFFVFESSALESFDLDGTAFYFLRGQSIGLAAGIIALIIASFIKVRFYLSLPYFFYFLALALGVLCFVPGIPGIIEGDLVINGARRWLIIFGVSFQVAEVMKFCYIIFFAYLFNKTTDWKIFLSYLILPIVVLLLQQDLGSLLVIVSIILGLYFLAGVKLQVFFRLLGAGLLAITLMIVFSPYRRERLMTFFSPQADVQGTGFHLNQLKIGIGRGGWVGQGIGNSSQKFAYIPFASSDSIFAIVSEEVGFLGVTLILLIFAGLLALILSIAREPHLSSPEKLVAQGIFILFLSQIFINLGAISGLTPLTGITLPFFSAGGTSLMISLFLIWVIVSLTRPPAPQLVKNKRRRYV